MDQITEKWRGLVVKVSDHDPNIVALTPISDRLASL
jgi:hypothetical protein